ncbi:unnamed protein product [Urochloa decumbens]|uniref:Uncharacterized protein n=1 Tax=Urochloa decumbens TaxID=240449 RepID=A0ABC9B3Y6_9POAL
MHIGTVKLVQPDADPVFVAKYPDFMDGFALKQHPDAVRLWAQKLAPGLGAPTVNVPRARADFFTVMLHQPGCYRWAKELLNSTAWGHFEKGESSVPFSLPEECPKAPTTFCMKKTPSVLDTIPEESPDDLPEEHEPQITSTEAPQPQLSPITPPEKMLSKISPSTGPWSKKLLEEAAKAKGKHNLLEDSLTEAAARRSIMQKHLHNGFKTSPCEHQNCLGCTIEPPTISPTVIKNLGSSFCGIDPEHLTVEKLNKKKKPAAPGGKKQVKKKAEVSKNDKDDKQANKKTKK